MSKITAPFVWIVCVIAFIIAAIPVHAEELSPNNKFGIHLAQPHLDDIRAAASLLNSTGGDWGYVTLVIQENDRNREKWQGIFDLMREYHLIPIVRIATQPQGAQWRRPEVDDANGWADFLNSLNWVVKNRYVILFNEPNHATEWGGSVDVPHYSKIALAFGKKLKEKSGDFFVMPAGLDASAPNAPPRYLDEEVFMRDLINNITIEQFNNVFSGLASHSYPNPGFSGSPYAVGKGTVRTYLWELSTLANFGVRQPPVFITETGWVRRNGWFGEGDPVAANYRAAFENVWLQDERVKAVTPFVLDYQGEPFLEFSWKLPGSDGYYPQFYTVSALPKEKGEPEQLEKGDIAFDFPKELVAYSTYHFKINLKNTGQGLWDKQAGYQIAFDKDEGLTNVFTDIIKVRPFQEGEIHLFLKTGPPSSGSELVPQLRKNGRVVLSGGSWRFKILPLPSVDFSVRLFPKLKTKGEQFELQLFDGDEQLVFKKKGIKVDKTGRVNDIQNVAIGRKYRVVLLNPYYLPRQTYYIVRTGKNNIRFETMYPLDFDRDGKLSGGDLMTLIKHPSYVSLLLP